MDLLPGDVGFDRIGMPSKLLTQSGMMLLGDACRYDHARIALGPDTYLEAMPSGARIVRTEDPAACGPWFRLPLELEQRGTISAEGKALEGTPYSFADYLALAAWEWKLPGRNLLRGYVSNSRHMICSQLVDHLLCRSGFHLFQDGRLSQDVTPGDLFYACSDQGVPIKGVHAL